MTASRPAYLRRFTLIRRLVQAAFALTCLVAGYRFYLFYQWTLGKTTLYTPRPPAVEAFLPISALVSLKRLVLTGAWDQVHPAGLTIFLAALAIAFLLRKGFCGWICPIGFLSHLVELAGRRFKTIVRVPALLDYPLLSLKYLLLAFFTYLIIFKMDLKAIEGFLQTPYNMIVDAKMLYFFLAPTRLTVGILTFLLVISLFVKNFWCRYLCPYGALLGLLSLLGPSHVRREEERCLSCRQCDRVCPGAITVSEKTTVRTPECVGCMECVAVCPATDCLTPVTLYRKPTSIITIPALVVTVFLACWLLARTTGHWQTKVPLETQKRYYKMGLSISHPR